MQSPANESDQLAASNPRGFARGPRWIGICCAIVLSVGGIAAWYALSAPHSAPAARSQGRGVPVSVVTAGRRDLPVYISGLGTVRAYLTVSIHSQVDGALQEVLFTEGQKVKKGDLLARIDPRLFQAALDQAIAKKAQDEALLVAAQKDLIRSKSLAAKNFATEQAVDQATARVDQLKASIAADVAAIETAKTQLDYTFIRAPNDGRIGIRRVDPGNLVHATDANGIASLVLMQPSAVVFTLPSRTLSEVRRAMARGPVEVAAIDQSSRKPLATGTLLLIDNAVDQATATIRLKAIFPNEDEQLWPGDFVTARLLLEVRRDAIGIPANAVQRGPKGLFAWVVTPANIAEAHPIEAGPTSDGTTIVTAGLREGERVVIDGQYKLQQGAAVSIVAPAHANAASAE
ncbi:MAG: efflux RND transporter periplasmic adaptor subunit [Proteobacteria bacterium]|nr:MAG: efflux RND transporter periplasmic adaptor subunit [Pseudomonadota bacterium]